MPKQKSKRALRKRVRLTGTGRLRRHHAYTRQIQHKKQPNRTRHPRHGTPASRRLWRTRSTAAARQHQLPYSRLMNGLRKAGVEINRKVLADLAVRDPVAFEQIAEVAKQAL